MGREEELDENHNEIDERDKFINPTLIEGPLIGAYIFWDKYNDFEDRIIVRSVNISDYEKEIPKEKFEKCNTLWIEKVKPLSNLICCVSNNSDTEEIVCSSSFSLSPSFFGSTRNFFIENSGDFSCCASDVLFSIDRKKISRVFTPVQSLDIDYVFYDRLLEENIPILNKPPIRRFDFSMFGCRFKENEKVGIEYAVPSCTTPSEGTGVIVLGFPQRPTRAYLTNAYEKPVEIGDYSNFFKFGIKTGSIGIIKESNADFMLITNATCCGMSGSPIFTFGGELVGLLLESQKDTCYSIAMKVNHPTVVLEYLSTAGLELLQIDQKTYLPLIKPFLEKHTDLIKNAINDSSFGREKSENLQKVLDIYFSPLQ